MMILQKQKWKKVKNWSFGGFFKFEILNFWWIFRIFFIQILIFFAKYATFATHVVLWFLAVLFREILAKKFRTYHQNWKLYKQYFKILHISRVVWTLIQMLKKNWNFFGFFKIQVVYQTVNTQTRFFLGRPIFCLFKTPKLLLLT